jgi:hypothetical protein
MKIKVFSFTNSTDLEKAVNSWLEDKSNYRSIKSVQATESSESISITIVFS